LSTELSGGFGSFGIAIFPDGRNGRFVYSSLQAMPRKEKIKLSKVLASLNTVCPKCGFSISPDQILRVDSERIECPACRERFTPKTAVRFPTVSGSGPTGSALRA
jgi:predicted RNA-binding Zn-ribbon protein involved in translation (DUF1610 family)